MHPFLKSGCTIRYAYWSIATVLPGSPVPIWTSTTETISGLTLVKYCRNVDKKAQYCHNILQNAVHCHNSTISDTQCCRASEMVNIFQTWNKQNICGGHKAVTDPLLLPRSIAWVSNIQWRIPDRAGLTESVETKLLITQFLQTKLKEMHGDTRE